MSFLKGLFQCCNSSQAKADFSLDSPKQFQTISTNYTINQPTLIMKNSLKSVSLSSNKSLKSPNMKYNSVTCSPDYIPTNQYEISTTSIDDAKRLELFDVIGDLLYGEKVEITYKGIQNKSTVLTFDNMDIDTIKSINYFWIRTQQSKSLFADNDNKIPKDYVLNFICDYFSELSKTYLFMICYIKEINQYKIQFNNEFNALLSNNITVGISSEHSILLPKEAFLHVGSQQIQIRLISKNMLEVHIQKKKKKHVYHSLVNRVITIGKSENSTISFPKDNKLSEMNTTLYYDFENQGWRIQDGYKSFPSFKGTWLFSSHPISIEDGMHVKLWTKEFAITCK